MSGGKETPRQKMIGMMYLVLTALLALNVSKSILEAFVVVADTLENTNQIFAKKNEAAYASFAAAYALNKEKVEPYYNKAMLAKKHSQELIEFVNEVRYEIIAQVDGIPLDTARTRTAEQIVTKDQYDIPTNYFCGQSEDCSSGKAEEIRLKIIEYKKNMIELLEEEDREGFKMGLNIDGPFHNADGTKVNWGMKNFFHIVVSADICILNNIIGDTRNIEAGIVRKLYSEVSADDFSFDKIVAKVIPKSSYVLQGGVYEAEIFVAAYDSKKNPVITIGRVDSTGKPKIVGDGIAVEDVNNGVGFYKVNASSVGEKKYSGIISMVKPSGEEVSYDFYQEYTVAKPSLTVSATKMNVFYIGVDNPVSISVPGVSADKLKTGITSGATLVKKGDEFIVSCKKGMREAIITVNAMIDGKPKKMGDSKFRVKKVPNPIAFIGGVSSGTIPKAKLLAAGAIIPKMENFDFELYFTVRSFTFTMNVGGDLVEVKTTGNKLNSKMKKLLKGARKGQKLYIEDIQAFGAGSKRTLSSINLRII